MQHKLKKKAQNKNYVAVSENIYKCLNSFRVRYQKKGIRKSKSFDNALAAINFRNKVLGKKTYGKN